MAFREFASRVYQRLSHPDAIGHAAAVSGFMYSYGTPHDMVEHPIISTAFGLMGGLVTFFGASLVEIFIVTTPAAPVFAGALAASAVYNGVRSLTLPPRIKPINSYMYEIRIGSGNGNGVEFEKKKWYDVQTDSKQLIVDYDFRNKIENHDPIKSESETKPK